VLVNSVGDVVETMCLVTVNRSVKNETYQNTKKKQTNSLKIVQQASNIIVGNKIIRPEKLAVAGI
jgi:hypothetical protein